MKARYALLGTLAAVVTGGTGISAAEAETGPRTVPLVRYFGGLKHYVSSGDRARTTGKRAGSPF